MLLFSSEFPSERRRLEKVGQNVHIIVQTPYIWEAIELLLLRRGLWIDEETGLQV